ncbi:class I SAM-dependent RNA methyltransferase [Bartonella ancashensis]|uniref:SAM-dependent methyltransferases related to tRNA (Uracil-5-)-methyltransferase n=1 Tax=Bartonella ancashensis TaxID=1318743 RepID=A0A0M4LTR1_9HYPH|nr:class I SAM-dependent RNA methyltransferase [Bartonella ancashensis]ALE04059.1 SAM-dependent methyltransferases related to tRNA (uracil-5-)-methyltransferase [Bartonella ancashensis]
MRSDVIIDHIGANGHGVAKTVHGLVHVPCTLPGEVVEAFYHSKYGNLIELKEKSLERVSALCRHFGKCGGCALQHWHFDAYHSWKRQLVVDALKRYGLDVNVTPLIECELHSRRRITLTAIANKKGYDFGFNGYHSHEVITVEECPITRVEIVSRLSDIRKICAVLGSDSKRFHIKVTSVDNGLDISLSGCSISNEITRQEMICAALSLGIIRLSVEGEILVERRKPLIHFDDICVEFPSGGFLQATVKAENAISNIILDHFKKAKNAVDLFSGIGTFSLRMAKKMNVHAVEYDEKALANLDRAARVSTGLKTVTCEKRDLFRRPLSAKELEFFDSVVFDPPRVGAEEQVRELAKTTISRVVAVSCNPITLSRDLSILTAGGYIVEKVIPIDQFLWSPHVETVAILNKRKTKTRWKL